MKSIPHIYASDETKDAALMTLVSDRAEGAKTLSVDSLEGVPASFFASVGPATLYTDPLTNAETKFIKEGEATNFAGHLENGNIVIDEFDPGYEDNGNSTGDIVVIRPTAGWANNLANVAQASKDFRSESFGSFVLAGTGAIERANTLAIKIKPTTYYIDGERYQQDERTISGLAANANYAFYYKKDGRMGQSSAAAGTEPAEQDGALIGRVVTGATDISEITEGPRGAVGTDQIQNKSVTEDKIDYSSFARRIYRATGSSISVTPNIDCSIIVTCTQAAWGYDGGVLGLAVRNLSGGLTRDWAQQGVAQGHNGQGSTTVAVSTFTGLKKGKEYKFDIEVISGRLGGRTGERYWVAELIKEPMT